MEDAQIKYFLDRYAGMTDEELSYLLVTRGDSLSEEAGHALRTIMASRDPGGFQNELKATTADVGAQIRHADEEVRKQKKSARHARIATRLASLALLVIGLCTLLLGKTEGGVALCVAAVAMFLYFEVQRLIRRFLVALFNPNSR